LEQLKETQQKHKLLTPKHKGITPE